MVHSGPALWVQSTATPPALSIHATSAWLETPRILSAGVNSDLYHVGDTAVITASLSANGTGITGANVVAELQFGNGITNTVTLSDEGGGNYTANYAIPDVPGYVFGQVKASGNDSGAPFSRKADLMFAIASEAVQLNGNYSEHTPDDNGDGWYDALLKDFSLGGVVAQTGSNVYTTQPCDYR